MNRKQLIRDIVNMQEQLWDSEDGIDLLDVATNLNHRLLELMSDAQLKSEYIEIKADFDELENE